MMFCAFRVPSAVSKHGSFLRRFAVSAYPTGSSTLKSQQVRSVRSKTSETSSGGVVVSSAVKGFVLDDPGCKVVVVTSGKGGVGKTTSAASFAYGLAAAGKKVCAIDFDIGLRNLDLHLGMERRVVFDFVHVIHGECQLHQAIIKDRHNPNLHLLAASQTRDKSVLTKEGVAKVLSDLKKDFQYIVCDSPAGIENGAFMAMYFADEAIICTNPELSSVRDSDKMLGLIASQSLRAERNVAPMRQMLLVTRYQPEKVLMESMISVTDIEEMLGIKLIGVIPESDEIIQATNVGKPVISNKGNKPEDQARAAAAYSDLIDRYLGKDVPMRFTKPEAKPAGSLFGKWFKP
ncbi:mitochondrial septum site-determining protein MinD [Andalucia godoyi]|uniref:Mitochondrial MinD n=1 Tax=Andalucia godoyi TaxID=505711 RepID=A0A0E3SU90_ANDGO|nr:mitochondrial MinD [Andalucia godoyi]KAF0852230.1 mitochondrial septum site-determining protein MinD [Andalucia godoyi]|eukprot:AKB90672.1 mitochondrial septum site-determining protein MinD